MSKTIHSERLDLIPMTPDFCRASIAGDLALAERLIHLSLPQGWPDIPDILKLRLAQLDADPSLQPWLLRAIGLRESGAMVGHIGFHTAPRPEYLRPWCADGVELGFSVVTPYRRRGYAREAVLALMHWARGGHGVSSFVMTISPDNVASKALAAGLGFVKVGSHVDEVDGCEDILVCEASV